MGIAKKTVLTLACALLASVGVAIAQHNHAAMGDESHDEAGSEGMMGGCQKHQAETMAALDQLEKTIAAGRQSTSPEKMKEALNQAQTQIAQVKHGMSMCPMMSGEHAQHGMHHMEKDSKQDSAGADKTSE